MLLKSKEDGRTNICSNIEKPINNENPWFSSLQKTYPKKKQVRRIQILTCMFQCPELMAVKTDRQKREHAHAFFLKKKKKKKIPAILALAEGFSAVKCF